MAWSPRDPVCLVSGSDDNTVRLWGPAASLVLPKAPARRSELALRVRSTDRRANGGDGDDGARAGRLGGPGAGRDGGRHDDTAGAALRGAGGGRSSASGSRLARGMPVPLYGPL